MRMTHPLAGALTLRYETFTLPGDQEQSLATYHAEPGSAPAAGKDRSSASMAAGWGTPGRDGLRPGCGHGSAPGRGPGAGSWLEGQALGPSQMRSLAGRVPFDRNATVALSAQVEPVP
ncbi:hypothetical protein ACIBQX_35800 [Nonomuraea sp. NPDC049714]|uniref:MmyB family transcriptional regulator n=1 Tax=Nonomuraea sp. NPDC049714 TaxID=3364357 RepID=UPI003799535A